MYIVHFVQCVHFIRCSKKISKWQNTRACNPCNLNGRSISWRSRVISLCSCWSRVIHIHLWSPADQEWYTHEWSAVPQIKTDHLPTIRSSMISSLKSSVTLVTVLHQGWVQPTLSRSRILQSFPLVRWTCDFGQVLILILSCIWPAEKLPWVWPFHWFWNCKLVSVSGLCQARIGRVGNTVPLLWTMGTKGQLAVTSLGTGRSTEVARKEAQVSKISASHPLFIF